ncbi:MAG: hypothetical protein H6622_12250 [Halobacteriovoraceae bacterium]|nr:hypothetical protein [Halobacteriovoraceae bacterium]
MEPYDLLKQNFLNFNLRKVKIRELLYLDQSPTDIYTQEHGRFLVFIHKNTSFSKNIFHKMIQKGVLNLFVHDNEYDQLIHYQQDVLRKSIRSLSIGELKENAKKVCNLLTINMEYLYRDPTNDQVLELQYQSVRNLGSFLQRNSNLLPFLYNSYIQQKHHFIFAQPMLSSFFVFGCLKHAGVFNERDIESLFVTSYFKDIGMSAIPTEKYEQQGLSIHDKKILSEHPERSVEILKGRIPLSPNFMNIILKHHTFSLLNKENILFIEDEQANYQVSGFETMIVSVMDIIAAMITGRPFREPTKVFAALELVKRLVSDHYPQEFKLIVTFFKSFFHSIR